MIYKYPLKITDEQYINVHDRKAKPLSVGAQGNLLVMWVLLDEQFKDGDHQMRVEIYGTGNHGDPQGDFVGTVQMPNGLVWHIFV